MSTLNKLGIKPKGWTPKKFGHHYPDFLLLTSYCISRGIGTPEAVANEIHEQDWLKKDSDQREYKSILRHVKQCWYKASEEQNEIGKEEDFKRLTEPEKVQKAIDFVQQKVYYDTLQQTYIDKDTRKELSPTDCFMEYNHMINPKLYIPKVYFEYVFESNKIPEFNPIKEWADGLLKHNKNSDPIKKLCSYIPAKNPRQLELFLKSWLIRTYIQAVHPVSSNIDYINRHFLILQSTLESSGKSKFLSWLSPKERWVKVSGIEPNKDGKRALASYMIVVDDEMAGLTNYKEINAFKALISMPKVDVRLPYAKKDSHLPRIASFCGSCNDPRIFSVGEQNTRFLAVPLEDKMFDYRGYTKNIKIDEIWAQAKYLSETDWLIKNEKEIKELKTSLSEYFEKESLEKSIVDSHIREQTQKEKDLLVKRIVLTTSDILSLINDMERYEKSHININVLGSVLIKKFGAKVNGYRVKGLGAVEFREGAHEYESNGQRALGYQVYFSVKELILTENDKDFNSPKKAKRTGK